jgi:hypothetical protein
MAEPQYPPPRSVASVMKKEQLQRQFAILGDILNAGTLLIDVRRTDFEGGTIRGSLNLPAQSFPLNMPTLYRLCAGDGLAVISRVVFYCGKWQFRTITFSKSASLAAVRSAEMLTSQLGCSSPSGPYREAELTYRSSTDHFFQVLPMAEALDALAGSKTVSRVLGQSLAVQRSNRISRHR